MTPATTPGRTTTPGSTTPTARQDSGALAREILAEAILRIVPDADLGHVPEGADLREELELDSLDFLEVVEHVGMRWGRRIDEEDYGRLRSISDWVEFLTSSHQPVVTEHAPPGGGSEPGLELEPGVEPDEVPGEPSM
jgi:acyl carrier protein